MSSSRATMVLLSIVFAILLSGLLVSCPTKARMPYQKGLSLFQGNNYGEALTQFELSLAADPEQKMALFYKARCLYELDRYDEALPDFEEFLVRTESERAAYSDERFDAEFFRDKCKQELDIEVPQDPGAIPPERMGG